ncbi:hypothetical protein ABPG72_001563 [Tetrahymena utriculariae]
MNKKYDITQQNTQDDLGSKKKYDNSQKIQLFKKIQQECVISRVFTIKQTILQVILEFTSYLFSAGILFLIFWWIKEWRFKCFFTVTTIENADRVVIYGPDGDIQILKLFQVKVNGKMSNISKLNEKQDIENNNQNSSDITLVKAFDYRFNKYQYINREFIPYCDSPFDYKNKEIISLFKEGLTPQQIQQTREKNGRNNTDIPDKGVIQLTFEELFSPFYLFQVGSTILWLYEGYRIYAYIIIGASTISVMLKIYEERLNFSRLREFSFFRSSSCIIRNGDKQILDSQELCFGDKVILREGELAPCDLVVVKGSAVVNEAMLTGESIPIVKTSLSNSDEEFNENKQNVIYCGSRIQQVTSNLECIVIRIGFETLKGNLIRSIMYPKSHSQISFKNDSGKFLLILGSVALISFFVALKTFIDKIDLGLMETQDVIVRCLDLVTISVPPALPTCLSFGISFSLKRLLKRQVYCINPEKINICGIIKTICFDKTGTLTEEKLSYKFVSTFLNEQGQNKFEEQVIPQQLSKNQRMIMSSCHSLMLYKGKNAGDPLDVEMFENSGSDLIEEDSNPQKQINGNKVISEISLKSFSQNQDDKEVISVLKRFQFESEVERMSSLISYENQTYLVTKGSPEKVKTICLPNTIPKSFDSQLQKYTQEGYRVIALCYKPVQDSEIDCTKERLFYEHSLIFTGFLVFENKLKPETIPHIKLLLEKKVQIHMVTGDNPLTSLSVAKQCDILDKTQKIGVLDVVTENGQTSSSFDGICTPVEKILENMISQKLQLVMTGAFFGTFLNDIKTQNKQLFALLLSQTKVYARMKPDQKQSLIRNLQSFQNLSQGYSFIGMCGDGANDCQALKDADMGISLGEAEASIAASFTSKIQNISIIEYILREGRCCLATSFQCFKFMALYSIIQTCTTAILYQRGAVPGDYQFLYWDLFIILPLAFLIGLTDSAEKLTVKTPSHRLFSYQNIFSVIGLGIIQFIFLIIPIAIIAPQKWYISPIDINIMSQSDPSELLSNSFDNAVLFWVSNFQYICSVIAFSVGSKYKKPFYTNIYFTFFLVAIITLSIYSVFSQDMNYTEFFQISAIAYDSQGNSMSEMPYYWRYIFGGIIIANMIINILYEKYIVNLLCSLFEKLFPSLVYHGTFNTNNLQIQGINQANDNMVKIEMVQI